MKRHLITWALISILLSGCASFRTINIVDQGPLITEGERYFFRDQTLYAEFDDSSPTRVASVEPIVYNGDLYLSTTCISGAGPTKFEIDVSGLGLGDNWTDRVYVYGGSYDGINSYFHRGPLPQHTKRWKIRLNSWQRAEPLTP